MIKPISSFSDAPIENSGFSTPPRNARTPSKISRAVFAGSDFDSENLPPRICREAAKHFTSSSYSKNSGTDPKRGDSPKCEDSFFDMPNRFMFGHVKRVAGNEFIASFPGEPSSKRPKFVETSRTTKFLSKETDDEEILFPFGRNVPIRNNMMTLGNKMYAVKEMVTDGQMNHLFFFAGENQTIVLEDGTSFETDHVVIKCPRKIPIKFTDAKNPKNLRVSSSSCQKLYNISKELKSNKDSQEYFAQESTQITLETLQIGIPHCYIAPGQLDRNGKATGFWIVEKLSESVSIEEWQSNKGTMTQHKPFSELTEKSRMLLTKVKNVLKFMAEHGNDCDEHLRFFDFSPSNLMLRKDGEFCYVDTLQFGEDDDGFSINVSFALKYLEDWSGNNPKIKAFLDWRGPVAADTESTTPK